MGGRLLRSWLEKPLLNPAEIRKRLAAVRDLVDDLVAREEITRCLKEITDLERLIGRMVCGSAGGRDLVALAGGLRQIPRLRALLEPCPQGCSGRPAPSWTPWRSWRPSSTGHCGRAALLCPGGGIIRAGYSEDVDRLRNVMTHGKEMVAEIETRTRETCGIKNIRIKYNKVFGYYIEVAKSQTDLVPADWVRKQTTVNAERYINQELKDLEHTILSAKDQITDLEYQLFAQVRQRCADLVETIQRTPQRWPRPTC